ncbi:amidohydrolase [Rhodococcus sp. WS3]|uniref:amidohydrolase family protein n=1 Tax=Rhodococcus sp. WS3 TaxID=2486271 RepID=UPI0011415F77|nr:amidohydrolase family protein [Rhodococcus sp. WS3]ROZ49007.1 amidohydrolase [Rhodococcus sp. WS3]
MTTTTITAAVDCDLHVAPPSFNKVLPYLDSYWKSYIDDSTVGLSHPAYPLGAATTGGAPAGSYDQLAPVLNAANPHRAILNCLALDGVHRNPYYAAAMATAVNDWVRDEFLVRDERLRASIAVSTLDIPAAVKEVERLAGDGRFAQILLPVRADVPYGNRLYHPLYAVAQEHGFPIALHAWGRGGKAPSMPGVTATYLEDYASNAHIAQVQMMSFVAEGVFSKFPQLKVVFMECGFSWLPPQLWRFDKDWKGVWREVPWVKERPSEYVRRHMRFTTEPAQLPRDPRQIAQLVEMVGPELLMYASDYPHDHGDGFERLLAALSDEDAESVLRGTAAAFYGDLIA